MVESKAFKELSHASVVLYIRMLIEYQPKYIHGILESTNSNNIKMPYTDKQNTQELMTKRTFFKSIDELIAYGFIKVIKSGYEERICNIYGFNDMWQNYGKNEFCIKDEWKRPCNRQK